MPPLTPTLAMPGPLKVALMASLQRNYGDDLGLSQSGADVEMLSALDAFWSLYPDKGRLALRLQYLYTCREALDYLRRRVFDKTSFTEDGVEQSYSDALHGLEKMRADLSADILVLETQLRAGLGAAVGTMLADRPGILPRPNTPDPNSPLYRGDPLAREYRWWNY